MPAWVRRVVLRGLAADPSRRWPSVAALVHALDRDPQQRRRRLLLGGCAALGASGLALVGWSSYQAHARVCDGVEEPLVAAWTAERRAAVEQALRASGRVYADEVATKVLASLDAYTRDWVASSQDACAAARLRGTQSTALMDARVACLERRRRAFTALVDVLAAPADADADKQPDRSRRPACP